LCYAGVCMDALCQQLADDLEVGFGELVAREQDLVHGVALRVVRDRDLAQDVAQEAFVRAYRALARYPAERILTLRPRPWLARITLNLARNELRRRRQADSLDRAAERLAASDDGPVRLVERDEERRAWQRLLDGLPERYRLAVALRHVDCLTYPEMADALGRPLGSVKSDVHRGVALLRAAWDAEQRRLEQRQAS